MIPILISKLLKGGGIYSCLRTRFFAAACFLLLGPIAQAQQTGLWMQDFMQLSPNQWTVYQRKVDVVSKEAGNARILDESPTLIAMKGMDALLRQDVSLAKEQAKLLEKFAVDKHGATWFEFRWNYTTSWPYKLNAPWVSGLAQGLGLSLNTWLYQATKEQHYLRAAKKIARSYLVSIEDGGFVRKETGGDLFFEEYPLPTPTRVLNGAAIATLALQDYASISGEDVYDKVLQSAYGWWNKNISKYTVVLPEYPEVVSAYSLAPHRNEILFRILSEQSFDVVEISLTAKDQPPLTLHVGQANDSDRSGDSFLWFNPQFQNWSEIKQQGMHAYRSIVPKQGEYNHAPFTFSVSTEMLNKPAVLNIHVKNLNEGESLVQLYTGKEYVTLGKLTAPASDATISFPVAAEILNTLIQSKDLSPPVEPAYFTDNHLLIKLLASAGHSPGLQRAANRLEPSTSLTPGIYDASARTRWLLDDPVQIRAPVNHGEEAWHTEYPSVLEVGGVWHLFYSAIGEDSRWRVLRATSQDSGATWGPAVHVLNETSLEFGGSYAFPTVVWDKENQLYLMVFSADFDRNGTYDAVMLTDSKDLKTWSNPRRIANEGGLAPILWHDGEYYHVIYTIKDGESFHMMEMLSLDRLSWTLPRSIASSRARRHSGFYTLARLPSLKDFFMMERFLSPGRIEWRVMCRASDSTLIDVSKSPFYVLGAHPNRWDDYQYGMSFFRASDGELRVFFNGIPFGAEHGGSMAMAGVDEQALWKNIDTSSCH